MPMRMSKNALQRRRWHEEGNCWFSVMATIMRVNEWFSAYAMAGVASRVMTFSVSA